MSATEFTISKKLDDLSLWLESVFSSKPPDDRLQACRRAAEAICKLAIAHTYGLVQGQKIISGTENPDGSPGNGRSPDLKWMIDHITSRQSAIVRDERTRNALKTRLEVLRVEGNAVSHDRGVREQNSAPEDLKIAIPAVSLATKWLCEDILEEHRLEPELVSRVEETLGSKIDRRLEDFRSIEIASLCYPNQSVTDSKYLNDWKTRIIYDYVSVEIAKGLFVGFLFLGRNASLENSIQNFFDQLTEPPIHLIVCSPKAFRQDGRQITRLESIREIYRQINQTKIRKEPEFYYTEDLLWEKCLSSKLDQHGSDDDDSLFVDQEITKRVGGHNLRVSSRSLQYAKEQLEKFPRKEPLILISGGAGAGKSTFCKHLMQLINKSDKKHAILISSTDLRDAPLPTNSISSVVELYAYYSDVIGLDNSRTLERSNLELNISCGNLVLIIDGLDEIESTLKDRFLLDEFVESAVSLNNNYENCTIFITFRDYYAPRFEELEFTSLYSLPGFTDGSIQEYLNSRFPNAEERLEADKLLSVLAPIRRDSDNYLAPIYLALISNIVECMEGDRSDSLIEARIGKSEFFIAAAPVDSLLHNLITREISKQSLPITPDQYFGLLREVCLDHRGKISKTDLDEYVELVFGVSPTSHRVDGRFRQFYVSPLLKSDTAKNSLFSLRYDYLDTWIKARFLASQLREYARLNGNVSDPLINTLAELYYGSGELISELVSLKAVLKESYFEHASKLMSHLTGKLRESTRYEHVLRLRRAISGLTYLALSDKHPNTKEENTRRLLHLFGGQRRISYVTAFGEFFPIDFSGIQIWQGLFEKFGRFSKCTFPKTGTVFFDTTFRDVDPQHSGINNEEIFDSTCVLDELMRQHSAKTAGSNADVRKQIAEDVLRIAKVGFFSGDKFVWKSEVMYKKVSLSTDLTLRNILEFLVSAGFLEKEAAKGGTGVGYVVAKAFRRHAANAINDRIFNKELEDLITNAMWHFYKLDASGIPIRQ